MSSLSLVDLEDMTSDSMSYLQEFLKVYNRRPAAFQRNRDGMNVNHAFSLFLAFHQVQPVVIIESGVHQGFGTWFLRELAGAARRIFALDPLDVRAFVDPNPRTSYMVGPDWRDFADVDWTALLSAEELNRTLLIVDDHYNNFLRLKSSQLNRIRFIWFDDGGFRNDHYTFADFCDPRARTEPGHVSDVAWVQEHVAALLQYPAVFDACSTPGRQQLVAAAQLAGLALPEVREETRAYHCGFPPLAILRP